jgi:hypothetical protein
VALLITWFDISRSGKDVQANEALQGLVYGKTSDPPKTVQTWYGTPTALAIGAALLVTALNIIFW